MTTISIRTRLFILAAFALLLVTSVVPALGQNAALGAISGVVRDSAGAVVSNASVQVLNTETGATRSLTTDSDGHYAATFLQPGIYEVILTGTGFGKIDQKNVAVQVGQIAAVD